MSRPDRERAAGSDAAADDDWAWRRRIRANRASYRVYRVVVGVVGLLIVVGGLALVPLPGPGWVIVFVGLAVWASEFAWAHRLLHFARERVRVWGEWLRSKALWVKGLVGLAAAVLIGGVFYLLFLVSGVPGFVPDQAQAWLVQVPGLDG